MNAIFRAFLEWAVMCSKFYYVTAQRKKRTARQVKFVNHVHEKNSCSPYVVFKKIFFLYTHFIPAIFTIVQVNNNTVVE